MIPASGLSNARSSLKSAFTDSFHDSESVSIIFPERNNPNHHCGTKLPQLSGPMRFSRRLKCDAGCRQGSLLSVQPFVPPSAKLDQCRAECSESGLSQIAEKSADHHICFDDGSDELAETMTRLVPVVSRVMGSVGKSKCPEKDIDGLCLAVPLEGARGSRCDRTKQPRKFPKAVHKAWPWKCRTEDDPKKAQNGLRPTPRFGERLTEVSEQVRVIRFHVVSLFAEVTSEIEAWAWRRGSVRSTDLGRANGDLRRINLGALCAAPSSEGVVARISPVGCSPFLALVVRGDCP